MKVRLLSEILDDEIQLGLQGLNEGLPMGLERLSDQIAGIQRARYDLIGGDTGSGKTAFLDTAYVLNPFDYLEKNPGNKIKLEMLYFSLEIGAAAKIAKLMAWKIFKEKGVVVSTNQILSKGKKNRLPQDIYDAIKPQYPYFNKLQTIVDFRDGSLHPKQFYAIVKEYAEKHGTFTKDPVTKREHYTPHDPAKIILIIVDHLGLLNRMDKKAAIEELSQYAVWFRNTCGFSPVFVQQYNRTIQSTDRAKLNMVEPRLADFKQTAQTQEDANTVIALFSPNRYKLQDFYGIQVQQLKNRLRAAYFLKNRDGEEGLHVPLNFFGEVGYFREFPQYTYNTGFTKEVYEVGNDIKRQFDYGGTNFSSGTLGYGQIPFTQE